MPVLIGELHSMLLPAIFNIKRKNPKLKVSYIMTDGGALPANFSRNVNLLKQRANRRDHYLAKLSAEITKP